MSTAHWRIRATLFVTLFVVSVGFGIVLPILPHVARELGATPTQIGILGASYAALQFLVSPTWGRLSDRYGRKSVLVLGLAGSAISYVVMGLANTYTMLLIGRALGGLLAAATIPTAQALAADLSPPEDRARAMGSVGAAISLGFIFGPTIGGALVPIHVNAPFWAGALVTVVIFAFALAILREPERKGTGIASPVRGSLALVGAALRGKTAHLSIIATAITFGQSTVLALLTLYLVDRFQATPAHAGIAFGLQSTMSVALQAFAVGPLVGRLGEHRTIFLSLVVGFFGFVSLTLAPNLAWAIMSVMFSVFAMSLGRPAIGSAVSKAAGGQQGLVLGTLASFESAGRALGPLWAGAAYGWWVRAPFTSVALLYIVVLSWSFRRLWAKEPAAAEGEPAPEREPAAQGGPTGQPEPAAQGTPATLGEPAVQGGPIAHGGAARANPHPPAPSPGTMDTATGPAAARDRDPESRGA